jgi:four helix bundle protein
MLADVADILRRICTFTPSRSKSLREFVPVKGTAGALLSHMDEMADLVRRAQRYAAVAFAFYESTPPSSAGWHAAHQFYRAASSAASNYCAAKRGRSTAEFIAKLGTVVEEIDEAVRWLEHMHDIKIPIDPELLSEAEQLRRIWGASLGTARRNERARKQQLEDERSSRQRKKPSNRRRYLDPT